MSVTRQERTESSHSNSIKALSVHKLGCLRKGYILVAKKEMEIGRGIRGGTSRLGNIQNGGGGGLLGNLKTARELKL